MSDPIAEISEADATGAIAEIYRDIKAVTGVGQVNTIWRHWASLPPALEWAWGAVRPLYDDGGVAAAAAALVASVDISDSAEVPMEAFRAAGVGDHAVGTAAAIVEAYNRANSQNLVVMPALARFIANGGGEKAPATADPSARPQKPGPLPPILAMDEMEKDTAEMVTALSAPVAPAGQALIPSLYRHLAAWPALLAMAAASTFAPGKIADAEAAATALSARAIAEATALAAAMAPPAGCDTPSAEALAHIAEMADNFTRGPIALMTVLGTQLRPTYPEVKIIY
ncbi:MAG: hypothetical protein VCC99_16775 [Alphaproteobacteria bacterium]